MVTTESTALIVRFTGAIAVNSVAYEHERSFLMHHYVKHPGHSIRFTTGTEDHRFNRLTRVQPVLISCSVKRGLFRNRQAVTVLIVRPFQQIGRAQIVKV